MAEHLNVEKAQTCIRCTQEIKAGDEAIKLDDVYYHPNHFCCIVCQKELEGPYLTKDEKLYCEPCYTETFSPKCGGCGSAITGAHVTALGKQWHLEHFVCKECQKQFPDNKYQVEKDEPYCELCFASKFGDKCGKCGDPILAEKYSVFGKSLHPDCFECEYKEGHTITEQMTYQQYDDKIYCGDHFKLVAFTICKECGEAIEGEFYKDAPDVHPACLKCACGEKATAKAGSTFYCAECAKKGQNNDGNEAPASEGSDHKADA